MHFSRKYGVEAASSVNMKAEGSNFEDVQRKVDEKDKRDKREKMDRKRARDDDGCDDLGGRLKQRVQV